MKQNNMTSVREMFEQLSTEQLDKMLDRELHSESVDDNAVRIILSVLREREKDHPVAMSPGMKKAWEKYKRDTAQYSSHSSKPGWVRRLTVTAASFAVVLLLLVTVLPQQAEADSFWDRLARWTTDIVEFFSPNDNKDRFVDYQFTTDNPGLQQVYDAVVEMGVTEPVVPMWLPDGYALHEIKHVNAPAKSSVLASFTDSSKTAVLNFNVYTEDVSHKYHKDETEIEEIVLNETNFSIMRNNEVSVVLWTIDNIECSIFIDCQEDTLYEILKSIYMMEDE